MNDDPPSHATTSPASRRSSSSPTTSSARCPTREGERLEAHLASCPGCTEYLEQMRALAGSLGGLRGRTLGAEQRGSLIASFRGLRKR